MFYHLLLSRSPRPIHTPKYGQPTCNTTVAKQAADHYWEISTGANPATLTLGNSYFSCCLLTLSAWLESFGKHYGKSKEIQSHFFVTLTSRIMHALFCSQIRFDLQNANKLEDEDAL